MIQKNYPSSAQNHLSVTMFINIVFMAPRRTNLPYIETLTCTKAEI